MNFYSEHSSDLHVRRYCRLFTVHNIVRHVSGSTGNVDHTLDIVITHDVRQHNDQFICEAFYSFCAFSFGISKKIYCVDTSQFASTLFSQKLIICSEIFPPENAAQ